MSLSGKSILSMMSILSTRSIVPTRSMLLLNPHCHTVRAGAAPGNEVPAAGIIAVPQSETTLAQKVFVIETQLFQARAGHIGQLEFCFLRGSGSLAAFSDV